MKLTKTLTTALTLAAATLFSSFALADSAKSQDQLGKAAPATAMAAADAEMTNAEVRKVDKDSKKITLKHEAIKSLDMPAMTMVFQVKDSALLDKVQTGDKVKVKIIQEGRAYMVTEIKANE